MSVLWPMAIDKNRATRRFIANASSQSPEIGSARQPDTESLSYRTPAAPDPVLPGEPSSEGHAGKPGQL